MSAARVLVVDDDEDIRSLVRTLLERVGVTVFEAPDGREGLREFHAQRPDLVILDVSMPQLDGWQML
ncbi:MAG: response regulator, partial [Actinobacteria bacterium]